MDLVFAPEVRRQAWHFEGVVLALNQVFQSFPMRKIYAEVPEFNFAALRSGEGRYFEVDGILREHEWMHGRYWDTYIISIHRNRHWDRTMQPLLSMWVDASLADADRS